MADVAKGIIDIEINTGNAAAQLKALQQQINAFTIAVNKNNKFQTNATAKYTSELQDLVNASRFFTAETVKMRTSAAALDSTLRKGQATLGQFFNARFNRNSALFAETMGLAAERSRTLQTQFVALSGSAKGMQDALAIRPLAAFSSELSIATQRSQILTSMFKQGTTQLINFGKNVQWAGRQLMVGFTLPLTVFGTTAGKTFMELEKQAVAFKKVYGDIFTTPAELQGNMDAVMALGKEYTKYGVAVKDTVGLAAQAAAAGRRNKDLTDAVTQATRLSTLGQMDQNQALDTTIALQSAFRLSGQDLADTINFLNMVENQTVVSLQDLAAAIPRVAPVIKGLGGDVKDMAVFLAAMQEGGVSAEQGANALKSGLGSLINPTKQAKEMLAGFNINLDAIVQRNRGDLMGTVMDFARALQTLDEFSRQQALEQVFGKFQYARLGALFENIVRDGSQASQVLDTMAFSSEQLRQTAEKELSVIEQSFGVQLTAAIEKFKLAIAPIGQLFVELAIPVVNFLTKIVEGFNNLPDFSKRFIALATIITGLVIPAGTMFFGLLMNLSGTLAKLLQSIGIFTKGMMKGGVLGGIQAVTQSMRYMSLEEIDASIAAKQLGSATMSANDAFRAQVGAAEGARVAVKNLSDTYGYLINRMAEAAALSKVTLGTPGNALKTAQSRSRNIKGGFPRGFATGGVVPGSGNQDTVPAMLTPGEFVVTKEATKSIGKKFLERLNMGGVAGYKNGTQPIENQMRLQAMELEAKPSQSKKLNKAQRTHTTSSGIITVGPGGLETARGFVPEGYKLAAMGNRTLNIDSNLNQEMREGGKGVTGAQLLDDIKLRKLDIFQTMDAQFLEYLDEEKRKLETTTNLNSGQIKKELRRKEYAYRRNKKQVLRKYIAELSLNKDKTFMDKDFAKLSNSAFAPLNRDKNTREFHKQLLKRNVVRTTLPLLKETAKSMGITGVINAKNPSKPPRRLDYVNAIENYRTGVLGQAPVSKEMHTQLTGGKTSGPKNKRLFYEKYGSESKPFTRKNYMKKMAEIFGRKFAKGGSVPSLLTPGEFVVNKDAAAANRPFLDALNAGKVKNFQFGTPAAEYDTPAGPMTKSQSRKMALRSVGGRLGGAAGAAAFPGMIIGPMLQQSSNQAASALGSVVTGASIAATAFQIVGPVLKGLAPKLAMFSGAIGGTLVGVAALGLVTYKVIEQMNKMRDSGAALTRAMYGSADTVDKMAAAFGRQSATQMLTSQRAQAAGGAVSTEAQAAADQFMQTDIAKQMLVDIEKVKAAGGDAALAVRNQLARSIMAGAITPEEARGVAISLGNALNDQKLAVNVSGALTSLLGPNGEKIQNNEMNIFANILPRFDQTEIQKTAEQLYAQNTGGFFGTIGSFFDNKEIEIQKIAIKDIAERTKQSAEMQREAVDAVTLAYESGSIKIDEYKRKIGEIESVTSQAANSGLSAIAEQLGVTVDELDKIKTEKTSYASKAGARTAPTQRAQQVLEATKKIEESARTSLDSAGVDKNVADKIIKGLQDTDIKTQFEILGAIGGKAVSEEIAKKIKEITGQDIGGAFGAKAPVMGDTSTYTPTTPEDEPPTTEGEKSKIQLLQESIKQTKEYAAALDVLIKKGLSPEAAANLDAATAIELVKKKRLDLVKAINDQAISQRVLNNVLKTKDERQIDILEAEADAIDKNIEGLNEQLDAVKRLNDADQRQVTVRNKALEDLSKKEEAINKSYDGRIQALNKVKQANAEVAQQERDRISLASALTSGDIASAAQAAATMTENFAGGQIDNVQAELDLQRQREIDALTTSVNGQLLTRQQIQTQIDNLNQRMYERDVATWPIQDQITNLELKKQGIMQQVSAIQDQINKKQLAEEARSKTLVGYYKQMAWWANQRARGTYEQPPAGDPGAGGVKKAFGGLLRYTSNEPAPGMAMGGKMKKYAVGNIVPGLGNTDRVPALLTPGEFVVRKSVAAENMDMLKALNGDVFPSIKGTGSSAELAEIAPTNPTINNTPVYTYNVNVNVPNTDASPEEIANVVVGKLRRMTDTNLRSNRL